jgi:cytochrome c556
MFASQSASPTLKRQISVIAAAIFVTLSVAIVASAATPAEIQKERHEGYEALGDAFKVIRDNSRSTPDWAAVEKAVAVVQKTTVAQLNWFPKGSGPEAGKTRALPEIWTKPADFSAAQKLFADKVPALTAAVKGKDVAALGAAFKEAGGACKNCHDSFRAPE